MAKPKITRLGDPRNPYTKQPVSAEQAKRSARQLGVKAPKKKPAPAPAKKKSPPEGSLGRARKRQLDAAIRRSGG